MIIQFLIIIIIIIIIIILLLLLLLLLLLQAFDMTLMYDDNFVAIASRDGAC